MSEEKKPNKQRKSTAAVPPTEHKPSWQEKNATPAEIEQMLDSRVLLRYNEVRHRTEVHWLSKGPVIGENEQGLLTIFGGDGGATRTSRSCSTSTCGSGWWRWWRRGWTGRW